jgi:hypothetical protein
MIIHEEDIVQPKKLSSPNMPRMARLRYQLGVLPDPGAVTRTGYNNDIEEIHVVFSTMDE